MGRVRHSDREPTRPDADHVEAHVEPPTPQFVRRPGAGAARTSPGEPPAPARRLRAGDLPSRRGSQRPFHSAFRLLMNASTPSAMSSVEKHKQNRSRS